ncbi:DUF6461 domain-containing protein [Thermopolyspora sp. NPDC052614]|uniref:DUF6461 domain-containing protein n=1 Tax=Thermopolyspora sp. NPDC052614 TaxID=3155682 RepID=UPI0034266063
MRSPSYLYELLESTIFTEGLDDSDLWMLFFSALWIRGASLEELTKDFHLDPTTRTPCYLSEILDHNIDDGSDWVAEVNGWIAIVPGHGDGERLRALSEGGREALGFRMDMSGNAYLEYARDGRMIVSFDPMAPDERYGDDPHALDHLMNGLRFEITVDVDDPVEVSESLSSALELIGRFTETDIATDWFQARHSRFRPTS